MIPDERQFRTRGRLAEALVLRAPAYQLPVPWVTADSAHGQEGRFRRLLEESVAVMGHQAVVLTARSR
ncbi:hypothetical protein GCM10010495_70230 [Kitasatospora herbaricolor]|nr:SRSO17 transposase [Kitasatospora herbaricolor]GGV42560.1 hypothetical protein GCM10010495_70230 [Kitasatospora herbaricolor]